jgi:hypothetical protein
MRTKLHLLIGCCVLAWGCGDGRDDHTTGSGFDTGDTETGGSDDDGDPEQKLDVEPGDTGEGDSCWVGPDGEGTPGDCEQVAPPDSFDPEIQWTWTGGEGLRDATTLALVANLDDDNGDGAADPCDIPEVIVLAYSQTEFELGAKLVVLDGETGAEKMMIGEGLGGSISPALGDVDGDGRPDIVVTERRTENGGPAAYVVAYDAEGQLIFSGDKVPGVSGAALALADLDNDGDVEIFGPGRVFDHLGNALFDEEGKPPYPANTAADLDGDGDLEIISGNVALHHDGSIFFSADVTSGYPQVADLDDDPEPEILLTTTDGFYVLEHDGTLALGPLRPTQDVADGFNWQRPAVIHDFDADGQPEFGQSSRSHFATYERDGSLRWAAEVVDNSGMAAATAFDFLGDGNAEAMYGDEKIMSIFDDSGVVELEITRTSGTWIEYPVVSDIDNDGSAEIVVVSNRYQGEAPTVQVIRDAEDRWIQARRIWNQHTYHVTNVNEDGTIPQFEQPSWENLNTFRSNAQIEGGDVCMPPVG